MIWLLIGFTIYIIIFGGIGLILETIKNRITKYRNRKIREHVAYWHNFIGTCGDPHCSIVDSYERLLTSI